MPFSRSRLTLALSATSEPVHGVAEIGQDLGNPAHADAADADEMDRAYVPRQLHDGSILDACSSLRLSQAASIFGQPPAPPDRQAGRRHRAPDRSRRPAPSRRAAAARAASAEISDASRSGVNSSWRTQIAPPAFSSTVALASWSWSSACGSGTRMAGRPIARQFGDRRGARSARPQDGSPPSAPADRERTAPHRR